MKNYIKNKNSLSKGNFLTVNSINIIVKDEIMFDISFSDLENLLKSFPSRFLSDLDYIMFGNFDFLRKKGHNASYADGVIYVSSLQEDNYDILDDIVHEIGHCVEEKYETFIYGDQQIELEFIKKRKLLQKEMDKEGFSIPSHMYLNTEYDERVDDLFAKQKENEPLPEDVSKYLDFQTSNVTLKNFGVKFYYFMSLFLACANIKSVSFD